MIDVEVKLMSYYSYRKERSRRMLKRKVTCLFEYNVIFISLMPAYVMSMIYHMFSVES